MEATVYTLYVLWVRKPGHPWRRVAERKAALEVIARDWFALQHRTPRSWSRLVMEAERGTP